MSPRFRVGAVLKLLLEELSLTVKEYAISRQSNEPDSPVGEAVGRLVQRGGAVAGQRESILEL